VANDDNNYVTQGATGEYAIFLFKDQHTGQDNIKVTWIGKSDLAASVSTVYLQIYDRVTGGGQWETLDSNNIANAGVEFTLTGDVVANLGNYFDVGNWIACRVYQEAV